MIVSAERSGCISILYMIADFHNDYLTEGKEKLLAIAAQAKFMVCALYRGERCFGEIESLLRRFQKEHAQNQFLGLEDAGYAARVGVEILAEYAPVYASLTWNFENELAGGCMEDVGLKPSGEAAVRAFARKGIAVDCAHLGKKAFARVLDLTDAVVDSHTCAAALYDHPRNLQDWQIREIVARGGLIGIAFVRSFLNNNAAAEDVFRHMDYCVQKFGCGHFCFGTDFYGTADLPQGLSHYEDADRLRMFFERAGYGASAIEKLFVGNLRLFLYKNRHKNLHKYFDN